MGGRITAVELKDIELPKEMQRAMARQAEAERERRAKVIAAEGEVQAAAKLAEAAPGIAESLRRCSCAFTRRWSRSRARPGPPSCFRSPSNLRRGHGRARPRASPAELQAMMQSAVALAHRRPPDSWKPPADRRVRASAPAARRGRRPGVSALHRPALRAPARAGARGAPRLLSPPGCAECGPAAPRCRARRPCPVTSS